MLAMEGSVALSCHILSFPLDPMRLDLWGGQQHSEVLKAMPGSNASIRSDHALLLISLRAFPEYLRILKASSLIEDRFVSGLTNRRRAQTGISGL